MSHEGNSTICDANKCKRGDELDNNYLTSTAGTTQEILIAMQNQMNTMSQKISRVDFLEEKCELLEKRCNSLENTLNETCSALRHHKCLIQNTKWEYSAPPVPSAYWESLDLNEVESAIDVENQMYRMTCEMRHCTRDSGRISLGYQGEDRPFEYDEVLKPHWLEFAKALRKYSTPLLPYAYNAAFKIINIEISNEVLDMLERGVSSKTYGFRELALKNNLFRDGRGLLFASKFIANNAPELEDFAFINNLIEEEDIAHVENLCNAIANHPCLTGLTISRCLQIDYSFQVMSTILSTCSNLKTIDLSSNYIATNGRNFIPEYLESNTGLEDLDLRENGLDDEDAIAIADALKKNTNLHSLWLRENNFTEQGIEAFRRAFFDESSLNAAADSNHSCKKIDTSNTTDRKSVV